MRRLTLTALLVVPLAAAGCGHDHEHGPSAVDEYFWDCMDPKRPPELKVFASDESLREMLDKERAKLVTRDEEAATLVAPMTGLSASTAPAFMLGLPPQSAQRSDGAHPGERLARAPRPRSLWQRARKWLSPIGTAYAHCDPVSGENYLLRLVRDGEDKPVYAALASVTGFTPNVDVWKRVMNGRKGQTLRVQILRAHFTGGSITAGPFTGTTSVTLTVAD